MKRIYVVFAMDEVHMPRRTKRVEVVTTAYPTK